MRKVHDWDETDLHVLITSGIQESLTLEYKGSAALGKNDKNTNELSKDVSAFANSQGGIIVYGINEEKHLPIEIDAGCSPGDGITREWIENILISKIHPRIDGLVIKPIALVSRPNNERIAYVIEVPQAATRAPHQAADYRYYKRHNFQSVPMEDYEIRDVLRRAADHRKQYAIARALLIETKRIGAAASERGRLARMYVYDEPHRNSVPPSQMAISVLELMRGSYDDISVLSVGLAGNVLEFVVDVDEYNSIVETQPRNRDDRIGLSQEVEMKLEALTSSAHILSEKLADYLAKQQAGMGE